MKKKMISMIALGVLFSNIVPLIANATPNTEDSENIKVEEENITKDPNTENDKAPEKPTPEVPQEKVKVRDDFQNIQKKYPKLKVITQKDLLEVNFSTEMKKNLNENIEYLNSAINKKDLELLKNSIKVTLNLHEEMDIYEDVQLHAEKDQFDYLMFNSIALIFELTEGNDKLRNEMLVQLVDGMYQSSAKKFNKVQGLVFLGRYSQYIHKSLSGYVADERTKEIFLYAFSLINGIESYRPGLNPDENNETKPTFPENELPSTTKPDEVPPPPEVEDEIPPILPPIKPPVEPPTGGGDYVDPNKGYEEFEYVAKKGVCYKVTKFYSKDGNLLKVLEEKLNKNENGYCGIYDAPVVDVNTWNDNHITDISSEIWNNLSENDLNKLSPNTIQFTINKNDKKPYYYDTGIKASSNGTITFNQLKDALINITQKESVYLLEDKDKLMFIGEGKPLVIKKKNTEYSKIDILNLFNSFEKIGLKIDKKKSLEGVSIEDKLNDNELSEINFAGETVKLNKYPQIKDGVLQLPLIQIANLVGYKVEDNKESIKLTAKKDNKEISIELKKNSNELTINGVKKNTLTKSEVIDGVLLSEMNLIIKEIGYNLIFNSELGLIEIK